MDERLWRMVTAAAGAAACACAGLAASMPVASLTAAQTEEIVRAHNGWRQRVGVHPIRWSPELAALAQSRAERMAAHGCRLDHGKLPKDTGENLFGASALRGAGPHDAIVAISPTEVVDAWASEARDYNYSKNKCAWGKHCGHYTQVVWQASKQVGCGKAICPSRGQVWVCDYRPPGNWKGKKPY